MGTLKYQGDCMKNGDKATGKLIIVIAVFLSLMIAFSVISLPYINLISEPETQQKFKAWVTSLGVGGWLLILCIQIAQIVIAFIPGEPVEILAGVLYGGFGGLSLCLLGCVIASSGVFMFSKKFGTPLVTKLFKKSKLDEFAFLKDAKKLEFIVFIPFSNSGNSEGYVDICSWNQPHEDNTVSGNFNFCTHSLRHILYLYRVYHKTGGMENRRSNFFFNRCFGYRRDKVSGKNGGLL